MHRPSVNYNIARQILRRAQLNPDREAIRFSTGSLSYRQFRRYILSFASYLRDSGVRSGDRVGYIGFNHPDYLICMLATNTLGAIFVPINFRLTQPEITFIVNDAGCHTLFCDQEAMQTLKGSEQDLCCQALLSHADVDVNSSWEQVQIEQLAKQNSENTIEDAVSSEQHDVSLIMYTSGTTGLPKGAMLTHGNLIWNNINYSLTTSPDKEDVVLVTAPLFHIGALNVNTLAVLQQGGLIVIHSQFDPEAVLNSIDSDNITQMFGAPAMFLFMSQHPQFSKTSFQSLRFFVCGGAPVPAALIDTYSEKGVMFCQGYGLTETAPFGAFLTPEFAPSRPGSAGLPPIHSDFRVVDSENRPVAAGTQGEICLRGPNIMKGYWNRPDATEAAIDKEGWFHSGDLGYIDEDGFLYIQDRVKDMIISGGENIYPAEIESVLYRLPTIKEVACIGTPDETWGEAVCACVVPQEGQTVTLEELREHGGTELARYKLPTSIVILEALPRNPAGKVLKFKLKEYIKE